MGDQIQKNSGESAVLTAREKLRNASTALVCANGVLSVEELRQLSAEWRANGRCPEALAEKNLRIPALVPGGALARSELCDDGDRPLCAGAHVALDERGYFVAERYGYAHVEDGVLSIASPLELSEDAMRVHWLLFDERALSIAVEMLQPWLDDLGVVSGVDWDLLREIASQICCGMHECGCALVASGIAPIAGVGAQVEVLVERGTRPGAARADGTIDYRQTNSVAPVVRGQELARRSPGRAGRAGLDVCGTVLPSTTDCDQVLRAGEHVEIKSVEGAELYVATAAGVLLLSEEEIAVGRMLRISGDVDFRTGNLDFDGALVVDGSVLSGFSLKATGDIQIAGSLEPGAGIRAGGDLIVEGGILGRRTKVVATGNVRARYVQEATVVAGGDLEVGDFVYQARLRVGGQIDVARGSGPRGGSIIGGEAWGQSLSLFLAGSPAHVVTSLMAGMDPESARKLDKIREAVDMTYAQLRRLLNRFDLDAIDIEQIQNRISATTGPKRKLLAQTARQLGGVVQAHQKLLAARRELELRIGDRVKDACITVRDKAFSGVEVRIGEYKKSLREDVESPHFHVVDNELVAH